jgi:hypothetical protein
MPERTFEAVRPLGAYQSQAKWAKPMPKTRKNFIPAQSYLAYNWGTEERDPDLEFALFAIEQSGWTIERIEEETERAGHKVSRYCLLGWFYKGVRRPQNATLSIVMSVLGWERPWQQRG